MRALLIAVLVTVLTSPAVARAGESVITLNELEREALRNNPEIQTAARKVEAAEQRPAIVSGLPDPRIGYEVRNVGRLNDLTVGEEPMSMSGVVVSQEIPFPGKLSIMGRAAQKAAEREEQSLRERKLGVLKDLRAAYYNYYLAYRSDEILEQNKEVMKNFQRIAETRYATGRGIQQDVLRAQIEVSMLLEKLALEEQKKEGLRATINKLLGRNPLAPLGRPGDRLATAYPATLEELAARAVSHAPSVLVGQKLVEMNEAELSFSKREFLPDFTVSAGWFPRGDLKDVWSASVMLKVPLWFRKKSAAVKEAAAELSAARHEYESRKLAILTKVKDLYTAAKTSEQLLGLYKAGTIPQAQMALQSAISNYRVGKIDFLMLLDSQALLFRYQLACERELANLNKTISQIQEVTGELMREGESVDEK